MNNYIILKCSDHDPICPLTKWALEAVEKYKAVNPLISSFIDILLGDALQFDVIWDSLRDKENPKSSHARFISAKFCEWINNKPNNIDILLFKRVIDRADEHGVDYPLISIYFEGGYVSYIDIIDVIYKIEFMIRTAPRSGSGKPPKKIRDTTEKEYIWMADSKGLEMIQPYKPNLLQLCEWRASANPQRIPTYGVVKISEDVFNFISFMIEKDAKKAWMLLGGTRDERALMIVEVMDWAKPPAQRTIKQLMQGFEFKVANGIRNIKRAEMLTSTFNHEQYY